MTIRKTIITLTILHTADNHMDGRPLEDIAYEINEGHAVGISQITEQHTVAPENVGTELLALGNDGMFFNSELPAEFAAKAEGWTLDADGAFRNPAEVLEEADNAPASFWYSGDWEMLCAEVGIDYAFEESEA